ncbi:hypothetical protein BUALT_Bualt09G0102900 [Buddleja alternifolia]|uniref:Aluminum-activated malate transporter n=1 Tax=Buddleja alternifolia TaxID=168488 RepID=A0AAV6X2W3_9LAMI|nr:hypothetical protein BUALT_Bualt09G0102900 [Buddleja alternifolia]
MEIINSSKEQNCGIIGKFKSKVMETIKTTKKIGDDDPRRIIHSIKVGLALTLVSLFYYFRPLYDGFGQAGMWAVLTVVVVFEYTVGGTLSKSINRGCATLIAGALGVGAEHLAGLCGEKGEPIVLGLLVIILATVSTFTRFIPNVKRRYDYGVLIFILTFSLVAVSGYRVNDILQLAHQRLSTILLGGATCIIISISVCPVWAGQDLHNLIAGHIEKLAAFLEGFGDEFFSSHGNEISTVPSKDYKDKSFLQGYKSVQNSKTTEESLVASEFQLKIQPLFIKMSRESGKSLKELSSSIKNMKFPSSAVETHAKNSKAAGDELNIILENSSLPTNADVHEIMPLLVVASVLIDIIKCVEKISSSVNELSQKARFKKTKSTAAIEKQQQLLHREIMKPVDDINVDGDDHRDLRDAKAFTGEEE